MYDTVLGGAALIGYIFNLCNHNLKDFIESGHTCFCGTICPVYQIETFVDELWIWVLQTCGKMDHCESLLWRIYVIYHSGLALSL